MHSNIETERRFFIEYPDRSLLLAQDGAFSADIEQIYLTQTTPDVTARVRRIDSQGRSTFFKTIKTRISDRSSIEEEGEISESEYLKALELADPARRKIEKTRITIPSRHCKFEIDIYPFWNDRAVMEIELDFEKDQLTLPSFVSVIAEITGEHTYSNHSLSLSVPTTSPTKGKTTRLFDIDPYLFDFSSRIISEEKLDDGTFDTVLAASAFFPGGGGQECDLGNIGDIPLLRVFEKDGIIHHITEKSVAGDTVFASVDRDRRFSAMQNHSGEHIISGIAHRKYGCNNVGFHMGKDFVTLDFDIALTGEEIRNLELEANRAIWSNKQIYAYYPPKAELKDIRYRSKLDLDENVRLVEIEDIDICACCAPHVKRTGEIGSVRIFDFEKYKGGVRLYMLAGGDELRRSTEYYTTLTQCAREISANPSSFKDAFDAFCKEHAELKYAQTAARRRIADVMAQSSHPAHAVYLEDSFDASDMRYMTGVALKCGAVTAAVFVHDKGAVKFLAEAGDDSVDLRLVAKQIIARGLGKCGGNSKMIRGSLSCDYETAREFFSDPANFKS